MTRQPLPQLMKFLNQQSQYFTYRAHNDSAFAQLPYTTQLLIIQLAALTYCAPDSPTRSMVFKLKGVSSATTKALLRAGYLNKSVRKGYYWLTSEAASCASISPVLENSADMCIVRGEESTNYTWRLNLHVIGQPDYNVGWLTFHYDCASAAEASFESHITTGQYDKAALYCLSDYDSNEPRLSWSTKKGVVSHV